jgi:nucleoside-diphosphate-sugar epimerase
MRVLVTGASGFVGRRALAPLLERGFEVVAVGRRPPGGDAPPGLRWIAADLLDPAARAAAVRGAGASHLLHLAWYAEPGRYWTATENVHWVGATGGLLEAFAAAGGRRAVLAGTCAEYDWTATGPYAEAATPLRPATLYGVCKDATRRIAAALGDQLGVGVAWGRIFFLYGPGEHPDRLVASIARALARGERAAASEAASVRDFLHVDDVAGAFAAMVAGDVTGAVNVARARASRSATSSSTASVAPPGGPSCCASARCRPGPASRPRSSPTPATARGGRLLPRLRPRGRARRDARLVAAPPMSTGPTDPPVDLLDTPRPGRPRSAAAPCAAPATRPRCCSRRRRSRCCTATWGTVDFGRYVVVTALITLVAGITEGGLQAVGTREYALSTGEQRDR